MFKMFETIDELSRSASYKEKDIERLKREIEDLRMKTRNTLGMRQKTQ